MDNWADYAREIERFHTEKQDTHGIAKSGKPRNGEKIGWGYRDTARALGIQYSTVAENIRLAAGLKKYPELAAIPNRDVALKSLGSLIRAESHKVFSEENRIVLDSVIIGNVLETTGQLPAESFDIAYLAVKNAEDMLIIPRIYRILRQHSFFIIECQPKYFQAVYTCAVNTGQLNVYGYPFAISPGALAVLSMRGAPNFTKDPPAIITSREEMINSMTVKGQILLNPCSGRGEILNICKSLGVYSVGIEGDLEVYLNSDLVHRGEPDENPD